MSNRPDPFQPGFIPKSAPVGSEPDAQPKTNLGSPEPSPASEVAPTPSPSEQDSQGGLSSSETARVKSALATGGIESASAGAEYTGRSFFLNWPVWLARGYGLYSKLLVRFRTEGYPFDLGGPCIFIIWHSVEMSLLPHFGFSRGNIMVSNSKDGDILSLAVGNWGYPVIRGSSHKGAVRAVLSLKRVLTSGQNIIMAVDGPRGPRHVAKAGAFWLAAKTGRPICPVGAAVNRALVFSKSWSKSRLPLPFSRVAASFGDLLWVDKGALAMDSEAQSDFLTKAMDGAMEAAVRLLKTWPDNCKVSGKG
ncbi:MAG: lysophospholipid acyltransferase family protein [Deltaproteobacteria bacterium]|jgi:lysophospholipid acyltransferase (LPLAT)-like uncharacterized protein|nr:lysophospholipid acyltransferase family protein [Deltaproteobacteria bacterium]